MSQKINMARYHKLCQAFIREGVKRNSHTFSDKAYQFDDEAEAVLQSISDTIVSHITEQFIAKEYAEGKSFRNTVFRGVTGVNESNADESFKLPAEFIKGAENVPELALAVTTVFGCNLYELTATDAKLALSLVAFGSYPFTDMAPPTEAYELLVKRHGAKYVCEQIKTAITLMPGKTKKISLPILSITNDDALLAKIMGPCGQPLIGGSVDHALWRVVLHRFEHLTANRESKCDQLEPKVSAALLKWWDETWPAKPDLISNSEQLRHFLTVIMGHGSSDDFNRFQDRLSN